MDYLDPDEYVCGAIGVFIDDLPPITHANVRPFIISVLMRRGAVQFSEVVNTLVPHCPVDDLRLDDDSEDKTRLEKIVEEVLGEMVSEKIVRYNECRDHWVLSPGENNQNVPKIISWASVLGAQIPHHFTQEMGKRGKHI